MAGTVDIFNFLNADELSTIPTLLKIKIENHLQSLNNEVEEIQAKYEKSRVNSEQQYFEIEKQLISSNTKLESESASNIQLNEKLAELEKKFNEATEKLVASQTSEDDNLSTKLQLTKNNEQLETEKRDFVVLLEKRNREIDNLNDELKELSRKLSESNKAKCEAIAKLDEANSNQVHKDFMVSRLEQEKDNLQKQIDWLNKDVSEKSKELMTVRREKSSKLLEVQAKLEEKTEECSLQQTAIESQRKTNSDQATKIDSLIQRIKDIQDSHSQEEERYRQEIQARVRLVDLYKNASEEADNKATELTGAITELQKLLQEAASAHTEMENEKDDEIDRWKEEIGKREKKISNLEEELVNANDLLSALKHKGLSEDKLETMFPTAAATSKMLKSGMSLTQIYNEYVQATDSLQLEKEENKRLNTYLDQILQEIEQKAPLLKKQREDYDIALKSIDQMTRQLDAAMVDCQTLRSEADESHRKAAHLTKENGKQQQQIIDLSSQVKYLVKEVEELQGGRVVKEDISSSEVSSSSRLITDKLVTFRNIEELQEQNQKLLAVIRELSDKQEKEENAAIDARTRELSEQLESTQEEISVLKDARERQAEMVESIVRQRDMYRVLLQQANASPVPIHGSSILSDKSPVKATQKTPESDKKQDETTDALKQLQADFASYKKDKLENEKMLKDQCDKDRQEISDLRLQNAKLASQLDFSAERYKVLQGNAEGYRKEIATLRDKIQKYNTSVAKYEQTVNSLKEDLMSKQEQLSQSQMKEENLRREKDLVRASEMRISAELESMRRERSSQTMLMANLQAIQNNLERNEYETKQRLGKQLETLEREKTYLKKKMENEDRQHTAVMKHLENQSNESRKCLKLEMAEHQKTKDTLANIQTQMKETKQTLESTSAKLTAAEQRLSNLSEQESGAVKSSEELRDLKSQLEQTKAEAESLQSQLDKTRKHSEQYKTIADSLQQTIKEQNQTSDKFKESMEESMREANEKVEHLNQRVDGLEKERQDLLNENIRITEESHSLNADLRKQLASIQNELQEAVERRETAIAVEMSARQESEQQIKLAAEAQDKYERELMLHAADVEALSAVKTKLETINTDISEKDEKVKIAEKNLEESKKSWEKREKLLIDEKERLGARVTDLIAQTRALHEQMGKLSTQVISVQERAAATPSKYGGPKTDDSSKSTEQLLEVVKFLRKEKDIAEGKLDVVETECSRLKQRCDALEKQLENANTDLAEERQKAQAEIQTAAQHADVLHKVESYNLLQDSNKLLREEKEQLYTQKTEAEAKLGKLEEKIKPLQDEIRDLVAQRDSLAIDKKSSLAEVERWRARTSQLIEQSHKTDPEEHKRLVQEKEELRKQMTAQAEELHKAKAETIKVNVEVAKLQRQLTTGKEEQNKLNDDLKNVRNQLEERSKDGLEKFKTINQLKKIGRKYKEQAESVTKEFDDYKAKHNDELQAQENQKLKASTEQITSLEQKLQEASGKLETAETSVKELTAKCEQLEKTIADGEAKKSTMEDSLKEAVTKKAALEQQLTSLMSEKQHLESKTQDVDGTVNKMKTENTELQQEITKLKEENKKVSDEKQEAEKKLTRANQVLQTAKTKLHTFKETNEKLTTEKNELAKKLSSTEQASSEESDAKVASIKSMFESKIQNLEKDLAAKTEEITGLQSRIQQLQACQSQQVQPSRSTSSVAERISSSTSELPKTANIRPIASSPAAIKPQTVPVQPQSAASKATASIRPMAIAPTSVAPMTSTTGTPTATVMPTTVTQQDQQIEGEAVSPVQQLFPQQSSSGTSRPTQQVQRVIPTQESTSQEPMSESTGTETGIVEPQPSSSRETPVAPVQQTNKRQREETESPGDDSIVKRTKVTSVEEIQTIPEIKVTDESASIVTMSGPSSGQQITEVVEPDIPHIESIEETQVGDEISDGDVMSGAEDQQEIEEDRASNSAGEDDNGDAVIIVGSDEEGGEEDEEEDDDDDDENDDEEEDDIEGDIVTEDEEYAQEHLETYPYEHTEGDDIEEGYGDQDEAMQNSGQQGSDDDVVIIDVGEDDEESSPMDSQEPTSQPSSQPISQTSTQSLLPPLQPLVQSGSQLTVPRNQLTPFMLGSTAGFEDLDDCTVPSTPTLNVPRRGDGFAEAVSSPQVSQRFVFGSGGDQQLTLSGLAQLDSQAGMGMDDTRMDLSQLEEGSGRSVASTPLHTMAPATIISDTVDGGQSEISVVVSSQSEVQPQSQEELDQVALGEEGLEGDAEGDDLEGELGDEDFGPEEIEGDDGQDKPPTDIEPEAGGSQIEVISSQGSGASDRSNEAKPKIQKIIWENPATQPAGSPIQTVSQPIQSIGTTVQQYRPARGGNIRGMPQSRGNRGFSRGQTRRPMRGRGGPGMYSRRPPMF